MSSFNSFDMYSGGRDGFIYKLGSNANGLKELPFTPLHYREEPKGWKGTGLYLLQPKELAKLPPEFILLTISADQVKASQVDLSDLRFGYTSAGVYYTQLPLQGLDKPRGVALLQRLGLTK